ncbi:helix-hairpin-helix domain-containing protein [Streptococcus sp. KHUD_013]|uniref:helix-hairpin-helix domain-containing protein n=1 Tax=Streptococcus sp. KHUD_013 TaxID=3413147 RepID=UPI00404016E5
MAKKNVNRAKQYKHQNRHLLKKAVATVGAAVKEAPKKVEKAAKEVKQAASSVEEFAASLEGVALDRAQTFYDEGIRSVADFANWTEKELLALKGIGPATIKKLQELGVKFK